jgi:AsmA protein
VKKTLTILAIVLAVVVVLLVVVPFLIPVNQFRPQIEEKVSEAVGRKVQIGSLSLSLLSGSLGAENLSIADDSKFSSAPFLIAKSLSVGVEIWPLITSRQLNVTGVTIDSPQVTLLREPSGKWNYSSFGAPASSVKEKQRVAPATPQNPSSSSELSIKKLELKNGQIIVGSTSSPKRNIYSNVKVTASDVSYTSKFPVVVSAELPGGGGFKLDGNVGPLDQADTSLTPLDAKISVNGMNLASTGFLDPSLGLGGIVDLDATLASASGIAQTKGTLKLSKALLVAGGSPAGVPANVDFSTHYDLRKNAGVLNPSAIKIGSAVARLNGTYETVGEATSVNIKLAGESMPAKDLEAFLPAIGVNLPKGASLTTGTLSTNLNIKGPTNKLVTDGTIGLFNGTLAGFDLGSKMSAVSALTGLKTGKDLVIEKLTTDVHMATTGLRAEKFNAVLPALGTILGGGTVDSKNNLEFKMAATLTGGAIGAMGNSGSAVGGLLGQISGGGSKGCKGGGTTIPFQIQGTTADPRFIPDVGGIAAGLLKSQLGCTGGALAGATKQINPGSNPADAINAIGGLFGKKKTP